MASGGQQVARGVERLAIGRAVHGFDCILTGTEVRFCIIDDCREKPYSYSRPCHQGGVIVSLETIVVV